MGQWDNIYQHVKKLSEHIDHLTFVKISFKGHHRKILLENLKEHNAASLQGLIEVKNKSISSKRDLVCCRFCVLDSLLVRLTDGKWTRLLQRNQAICAGYYQQVVILYLVSFQGHFFPQNLCFYKRIMKNSKNDLRLWTLPKPSLLLGQWSINNEISHLYWKKTKQNKQNYQAV